MLRLLLYITICYNNTIKAAQYHRVADPPNPLLINPGPEGNDLRDFHRSAFHCSAFFSALGRRASIVINWDAKNDRF